MWFLQNQTVRYGTESINYLCPKIQSFIPDEIRESASLKAFPSKNQVMETK